MADEAQPNGEEEPKKKSKLPMIIGLVLLLAGGGGGFFAVSSGMLFGDSHEEEDVAEEVVIDELPNIAFVPLDPLLISLGGEKPARHLRFTAQLEVEPKSVESVTSVQPRIVDVLNGYLRAVETSELESPSALIRLRTQMLRRIQMVTGEGHVRDLLIMEFVLN